MAPEDRCVAPHNHDFCELTLVHAGSAWHLTDGYEKLAGSSSVVFVPYGKVHAYRGAANWHVTDIRYLAEWLAGDLRLLRKEAGLLPVFFAPILFRGSGHVRVAHFNITDDEMAACVREVDNLGAELAGKMPSHVYLKACMFKILVILGRAAVREEYGSAFLPFRREIWLAIEAVESAIARCEPFHVATLAEDLGMSAAHFSRLFKESTGWRPLDYYQRRRVQHACKLLLNSEDSITSVAYSLGYASASHFTNMFKRYFDLSPRAYRLKFAHSGQDKSAG